MKKDPQKSAGIILSSAVVSVFVADLLLEWCLLGWVKLFPRWSCGDVVGCSASGLFVRCLALLAGVRLGELFVPVALTGSIATGKSSVTKLLLEEGPLRIIDTDAIAHEILLSRNEIERSGVGCEPGDSVFHKIVSKFGDPSVDNKNILNDNGEIDRRKLGDIVFKDRSRRHVLNGITHPKIIWVLLKKLVFGVYCGPRRIVVADVPLLYESKSLVWLFAMTIVVSCSPEKQLMRLRKRNLDLSEQQCQERIASQIPVEQKVAMADIVIRNDGTLAELKDEVQIARSRISVLLRQQASLPLSTSVALIGSVWIVTSELY